MIKPDEDNVWKYTPRKIDIICCDCSLCHSVEFKLVKGRLYSRWKRDNKATYGYRKAKQTKKILKSILK